MPRLFVKPRVPQIWAVLAISACCCNVQGHSSIGGRFWSFNRTYIRRPACEYLSRLLVPTMSCLLGAGTSSAWHCAPAAARCCSSAARTCSGGCWRLRTCGLPASTASSSPACTATRCWASLVPPPAATKKSGSVSVVDDQADLHGLLCSNQRYSMPYPATGMYGCILCWCVLVVSAPRTLVETAINVIWLELYYVPRQI